ncbi:MAG: Rieske 2Fe-2S domain-containing protein [Mycobacteriales bacterium]
MSTRQPDREAEADAAHRSRMDQVKEGAKRDGVEIVHYRKRYVVPNTKMERRAERKVAFWLFVAFIGGIGFLLTTIFWPWEFKAGNGRYDLFTPMLGIFMTLGLGGLGIAIIGYAKWLLPYEESVQTRHDGRSEEFDRTTTSATMLEMVAATEIGRRSLIKRTLGLSVLGVTALAIAPLGGLIKKPGRALYTTPWKAGVRLVRDDGTPIKPADLKAGGFETVYPDVPHAKLRSDTPTLLIRLRPDAPVKIRKGRESFHYGDYYAYSKICTHAGCPVGLFEQQTNKLLCPCHQSQFEVLDGCRPVFGPASRSLPQLSIGVDEEGYFVARGDYTEPVGPAFWERG